MVSTGRGGWALQESTGHYRNFYRHLQEGFYRKQELQEILKIYRNYRNIYRNYRNFYRTLQEISTVIYKKVST